MESSIQQRIKEEGAKNIFQLVISLAKKAGRFAIDEIKLRNATDRYAENYLRRYCSIKILGMSEPIPLRDIFTEVEIIDSKFRSKSYLIHELEDNIRSNRGEFIDPQRRVDGIKIANEHAKLNILGAPGSGKSTILRKIGLECLTTYANPEFEIFEHKCIPILIELKRFKTEPIKLTSLIEQEFLIAGFPDSTGFIERALNEGKLLLLLDGLDEVPAAKLELVLQHIKDFTDKYYRNRFITSCRTALYQTFLKDFTDVEICAFNDNQIGTFIQNWFRLEKDSSAGTAQLFSSLLFSETNTSTLELARTPLLLTFLCITFDESQRFPSNRSSLYKQALAILMHKWAAEKRIHNDDIYQDLNIELETEMLATIAAKFYKNDKIFFYSSDLKAELRDFLEKRLSKNNLDISKVLSAIEVQQGILVERSPDIYSFSHLTIQEYLTAYYYSSPKRINDVIRNHLFESRWREVFLLLSGIGDPNDLFQLTVEFLASYASESMLIKDTINWVKSQLPDIKDFEHDACKRIFLSSLILRYKRYDAGFPNTPERLEESCDNVIQQIFPAFYDFIAKDFADNITPKKAIKILEITTDWKLSISNLENHKSVIEDIRPKIPLSKMLMGSRQTYRRKIVDELHLALKVPINLSNKNRNFYKPLVKYFEGYFLLIEAAKQSPLTSKETWKHICNSILRG